MKKILFGILALLLCSQLALATVPEVFVPGIGNKGMQGDVDGTTFNTERYPRSTYIGSTTVLSAVTVGAAGSTNSSTFPNTGANIWLRVLVVQGSGFGANSNWFVRFKGSFDNTNFGYIGESASASNPMQINVAPGDTLQAKGAGLLAGQGIWINVKPRNGSDIPFPWLQAEFVNPTGSGGSCIVTLEFGVRGY